MIDVKTFLEGKKKYTLIDKYEEEKINFDTKKDILDYLETVYFYDFDGSATDLPQEFEDLADYHRFLGVEESLKLYIEEGWTIINNYL